MNSNQRRTLAQFYPGPAHEDEWETRLHNALLGLANNDPGWMAWMEKEISAEMPIEQITRLIECRAKAKFLKPYHFLFNGSRLSFMIFNDRYQFNQIGHLPPG